MTGAARLVAEPVQGHQRRPAQPRPRREPATNRLLQLQRDAGNAATTALIQREGMFGSVVNDLGAAFSRVARALSTAVNVPPGVRHTLTASDLAAVSPLAVVARDNGMHVDELLPFNPDLKFPLAIGETVHIPSADELLLHAFMRRFGRLDGIERYATAKDTDAATIVRLARKRASGERGKGYGTSSTRPMTPNPQLRASTRVETKKMGDGVEYVYKMGESWKCNVYMQDTMHEAGFEMRVNKRQLYPLAGTIERYTKHFTVIGIDAALPGSIVQLDRGSTTAASHNLIMVDFLTQTSAATADHPAAVKVTLKVSGAESERAAVSIRTYTVVRRDAKNGYEIVVDHQPKGDFDWEGAILRFLEPAKKSK